MGPASMCGWHGAGMATDDDTPNKCDDEPDAPSLEESPHRGAEAVAPNVDVDEAEVAETFELPGVDLSTEQVAVRVLPIPEDGFTCSQCFLVTHRSQRGPHRSTVVLRVRRMNLGRGV